MYINTPFNYTGSKFKLLEQIIPHMDKTKDNFFDVFCGGGSVYTNVIPYYNTIYANDIITDLIGIHKRLLKGDLDFIRQVKNISLSIDTKEKYLDLRKSYNENNSPILLFTLMLCSHNNMLRFNKKFEYNQTWGERTWNSSTEKKVKEFIDYIVQYQNKINFFSRNFSELPVFENTFYYLDPPYLSTEAGYNAFWNKDDDNKLFEFIKKLDKNNSTFMLSGILGEHKDGKRWYLIDLLISEGYKYVILDHSYEKVSVKKNTKNSKEIIIMNY